MGLYLNKNPRFYQIFYFAFLIGLVNSLYSQSNIYFDRITTEDGLSQSDINSIYQDDQGFMWFATHEGLNKYDGYNFTIYNPDSSNPNSINSNLIFSLAGDEDGNFWIGTTGKGLNYFDKSLEKFTHFLHEEGNENSLINDHISSIYRDSKNRLWIGTIDGLDLVDLNKPLDSIKFQHFNLEHQEFISGFGDNNIYSIFEDGKGQVWAGGLRGLYKMSRGQNGEIYFRFVSDLIGLPRISVRSINEDNYGRLMLGTTNGLYLLKREDDSHRVTLVYNAFVNNILIDNNNIWVGTSNGLLFFDNSQGTRNPQFLERFTYDPKDPNNSSNIYCQRFNNILT